MVIERTRGTRTIASDAASVLTLIGRLIIKVSPHAGETLQSIREKYIEELLADDFLDGDAMLANLQAVGVGGAKDDELGIKVLLVAAAYALQAHRIDTAGDPRAWSFLMDAVAIANNVLGAEEASRNAYSDTVAGRLGVIDVTARKAAMQAMRDKFKTDTEIGAEFGISRQRVTQILG